MLNITWDSVMRKGCSNMIGFWVFMMCMELLIPVCMIGFGRLFCNQAPGAINSLFGYRTSRSRKNRDTWEFAHHYFGKLWYRAGRILLLLSVLAMLPVFGKSIDFVGWYGTVICVIQMVVMMVPVYYTESALKRTFDENGNRRR